jgi:hypothetical protein
MNPIKKDLKNYWVNQLLTLKLIWQAKDLLHTKTDKTQRECGW